MDEDASGTVPTARAEPTDSVRVQILATEHWSLLATRSMIWNEIFTRAGMFLTTLSASLVALALVAQATEFDETFRSLALLVLPVVLFLGIATFIRLTDAMGIDAWTVVGMNRLRHAYLEIAPDLEPYFVTSQYDDPAGIMLTAGHYTRITPGRLLAGTPVIVAVLTSVVAGVIGALLAGTVSNRMAVEVGSGLVVSLVVIGIMVGVVPYRQITAQRESFAPRFPGPEQEG